ncbi:MAG: SWI/SNF complex component snf12 [Claussenomyces sp. TS43310]|nr:MAG: SWI/SNF complex component snf12 [Claussenomyces sp. TS43310]
MQAQQESQRQASELAKRRSRKPTDKSVPDGVENCVVGDGVQRYKELRNLERKLDAAMMRKRQYIQDIRNRNIKRYRTLRVWISNTVEDQPWQGDGLDVDAFDFSTNMDSSYRFKIEGRLLDDIDDVDLGDSDDEAAGGPDLVDMDGEGEGKKRGNSRKTSQQYKLSHFFKSMTVDFERSRTKDTADQSIEWKKPAIPPNATSPPNAADFDQLEFKRGGDENVNINVNLVRDDIPERFALSPALAEILDTSEATRAEAVTGIWEYIKVMGLQEDDEKRSFRCDTLLKQIFQRDSGLIPFIPDAVVPHMSTLPPIKLSYTIRVDAAFHAAPQPTIYDIQVSLPDPLLAQLHAFNTNPSYPTILREVGSLNDQLAILVQALGQSKAKHTFFTSLSRDPGVFVRKWISSQRRDLEVMMGEVTRGGGEDASGEEFRRGGKDSIWCSGHVRESVNLLLSARPR